MDLRLALLLGLIACASLAQEEPADAEVENDDEFVTEKAEETPAAVKEAPIKIVYKKPTVHGNAFLAESFDLEKKKAWIISQAKKDNAEDKYDGQWAFEVPVSSVVEGDIALVLKSKAHHHAISTPLEKIFTFDGPGFVAQYEVKFQEGMECGGAYVKFLSQGDKLDLTQFNDKSPYTIMFGPDKCGNDNKFHFIFRYKNPKMKEVEEKHMSKIEADISKYITDKKTHLYTLHITPDNLFEVYIDMKKVKSGSLLADFTPSVIAAAEIDDPADKKPSEWDDREKILDPAAAKPDDWDDEAPEFIPDASATKPDGWLDTEEPLVADPAAKKPNDWDEDMDGAWEAPMIDNPTCKDAPGCGKWKQPEIKNPAYRGKWVPSMITNPNYSGEWYPRKLPNPAYFEEANAYGALPAIGAVGLELWSMTSELAFDNFFITDNLETAWDFAAQSFKIKKDIEQAGAKSVVEAVSDTMSERPWLWAVVVVVIALPIFLCCVYCCGGSDDTTAIHKKNDDASTEDMPPLEEQEGSDEGEDLEGDGDEVEDDEEEEVDVDFEEPPPAEPVVPRKRASRKE